MNGLIASDMDEDIPAILENLHADATMASGDTDFQEKAYKDFCKCLAALEGILKDRGVLPKPGRKE